MEDKAVSEGYCVDRIVDTHDELAEACRPYIGNLLAGDLLSQFIGDVHRCIIRTNLTAVFDSARHLAGRILTAADAEDLSWRLAGNITRLARGKSVQPWPAGMELEWVPVQINFVRRRSIAFKAKKPEHLEKADENGVVHRRGAEVEVFFLAGRPAGRSSLKFWSFDYCETVAKTALGFSRFNKEKYSRSAAPTPFPFLDVAEFYRLRMQVLVDPSLCRDGEVAFREAKATSSTLKWSRTIIRLRMRDGFDCPMGYPDSEDCHECLVGFDRCKAACHAKTYRLDDCPRCKHRKRIEVDRIDGLCVDCCEWGN